ncbi:UDP-4-amino-4,6-dideoxy-N-acetyl-beta-L-altrosamine transaminase [candidate division GN15 bacterium]|uniref:UDP-4-amino-4, 6-dideoxy-N-acetyl-beta-L-altrosamine transaminase n=1 Tax=candidate division GN15 bacterium TaxID=2072418 RepID=A0A855X614_9BACT|nr:MAG: UDP-4-amino-4,6-dideoxy-N-acetyl-beta-L-altrosamine transaminase [candidate division GN15 bacterium]
MSTRENIPLFDLTVSREAIKEVTASLRSGWLSTGPRVAQFERALTRKLDAEQAVAVNSATAGLAVALKAIGIGPGKEVITSPFTFVATIEAILYCGGTPVLADVNPETLTLDPESVASVLTRHTAAIVPVDIAGHPCDYVGLRLVCGKRRIPIISDSAHAFGATFHSKSIPQWADASVYSFYATKNLTCGEGGAIVSNRKSYMDRVRYLSRHGMTTNAFQRQVQGGWAYDVVDLGFKANMSDIHAAVGLGQLRQFESDQAKRRQLVVRYYQNLETLGDRLELPYERPDCRSAWHLFIVKLVSGRHNLTRDRFIELMKKQGIECGVHYQPVFDFSYYRSMRRWKKRCPNVVSAAERVVTLPLYPKLTLKQVDTICNRIIGILK